MELPGAKDMGPRFHGACECESFGQNQPGLLIALTILVYWLQEG